MTQSEDTGTEVDMSSGSDEEWRSDHRQQSDVSSAGQHLWRRWWNFPRGLTFVTFMITAAVFIALHLWALPRLEQVPEGAAAGQERPMPNALPFFEGFLIEDIRRLMTLFDPEWFNQLVLTNWTLGLLFPLCVLAMTYGAYRMVPHWNQKIRRVIIAAGLLFLVFEVTKNILIQIALQYELRIEWSPGQETLIRQASNLTSTSWALLVIIALFVIALLIYQSAAAMRARKQEENFEAWKDSLDETRREHHSQWDRRMNPGEST